MDLAADGPRGPKYLLNVFRGVVLLFMSPLSPAMGSSQHVCGTSLHFVALPGSS